MGNARAVVQSADFGNKSAETGRNGRAPAARNSPRSAKIPGRRDAPQSC
jgi:hypothetical protein